ncbi:RPM1-interacting protein 4-like protein isoform X1 [Tanacetum coccineum]|uniref:RPM1-interacting protein 4-like protein isoform X1 n=1 Tax=Tanacetum coccineum TaxID=301880 RepID=A0ABQ5BSE7_9ASTR
MAFDLRSTEDVLTCAKQQQRSHIPKFGSWDADNVPYTTYFENARKDKGSGVMINPNDPEQNPEAFMAYGGGSDDVSNDNIVNDEKNMKHGDKKSTTSIDFNRKGSNSDFSNVQQNYKSDRRKSSKSRERISNFSPPSPSPGPNRPRYGYNRADDIPVREFFFEHNIPSHRSASVPMFGAWDEKDPKSGEGFTVIFQKVKEEKHIAATKFPPIPQQPSYNSNIPKNDTRSTTVYKAKNDRIGNESNGLALILFYSGSYSALCWDVACCECNKVFPINPSPSRLGPYIMLSTWMLGFVGSYEAPLSKGNTSGSVKASIQLKDLMVLVPNLVTRVTSLEKELKETKHTLGNDVLKLVKKVKYLEIALKRKSKKVIMSASEGEEPEDQGRIIQDIDDDPLVSLFRESIKEKSTDFVTPTKASGEAQEEEISPTILEATKTLSKVASQSGSKEEKLRWLKMSSTATHKTKEQIRQEEAGLEEAIRLQAQMDEEIAKQIHLDKMVAKRVQEEQKLSEQQLKRKAEVQEAAQFYTEEDMDTIREKMEANTEVVKSLRGESISNDDFGKRMVEMINEKRKFYATKS